MSLSLSLNLSISQSLSFSNFLSLYFSVSLILPFSLPHSIHLSIYLSIYISIYLSLHLQILHFSASSHGIFPHFSPFFFFLLSFFSSFNHLLSFLMLVSGLSDIWRHLTLSVLLEWVVCLNEGFVVVPGGQAPLDPPLLHPYPPPVSLCTIAYLLPTFVQVCAYL